MLARPRILGALVLLGVASGAVLLATAIPGQKYAQANSVLVSAPPFDEAHSGASTYCDDDSAANTGISDPASGHLAVSVAFELGQCLVPPQIWPVSGASILQQNTNAILTEGDRVIAHLSYHVNGATATTTSGTANNIFIMKLQLNDEEGEVIFGEVSDDCVAEVGANCQPSGPLSPGQHDISFYGEAPCWPNDLGLPPCHSTALTATAKVGVVDQSLDQRAGTIELDVTIISLTFSLAPDATPMPVDVLVSAPPFDSGAGGSGFTCLDNLPPGPHPGASGGYNAEMGTLSLQLPYEFGDPCFLIPSIPGPEFGTPYDEGRTAFRKTTSVELPDAAPVTAHLRYRIDNAQGSTSVGSIQNVFRVRFQWTGTDLVLHDTSAVRFSVPGRAEPSMAPFIEDSCASSLGQDCHPTGAFAPGEYSVVLDGTVDCAGDLTSCTLSELEASASIYAVTTDVAGNDPAPSSGTVELSLTILELTLTSPDGPMPGVPPVLDVDCDGDVTAVDALGDLVIVAGMDPLAQDEPCVDIGQQLGPRMMGDADCNQQITAVDTLLILRYVVNLPVTLPQGCEN